MKRLRLFLIGLFAAFLPVLMAPTGGFPTTPTFQVVKVQNGARPVIPVTVDGTYITGALAQLIQVNHSAAANNRIWDNATAGSQLVMRAVNDAYTVADNYMVVSRSGTAVTQVDIGNAADNTVVTAAGKTVATFTSSSYTATATGCTTSPTTTVLYTVIGAPPNGMVTLRFAPISCTSNATTFTLTGAPAAIRPSTTNMCCGTVDGSSVSDNGAAQSGNIGVFMDTSGVLNFTRNSVGTGWTAAGNKGFSNGVVYSYPLQ